MVRRCEEEEEGEVGGFELFFFFDDDDEMHSIARSLAHRFFSFSTLTACRYVSTQRERENAMRRT